VIYGSIATALLLHNLLMTFNGPAHQSRVAMWARHKATIAYESTSESTKRLGRLAHACPTNPAFQCISYTHIIECGLLAIRGKFRHIYLARSLKLYICYYDLIISLEF